MNLRVDFVSHSTGRVLLSALFDTPPSGLTRRDCQKCITIMRETREKLEQITGPGTVRLTLDDFATSVFWYLVFFRPVVFDAADPWFGGEPWSIMEFAEDPKRAAKLQEMDLGLVYDQERNWLTLIWNEALSGILDGIEMCPSWRQVLKDYEKRTGGVATTEWWKMCARNHSFAVSNWRVAKHGYLTGMLWHRPNINYEDIIVFDLNGIDMFEYNSMSGVSLPSAKRARFVNFYTDDKREFQAIKHQLHPRVWNQEHRSKTAAQTLQRREERKEKFTEWAEASEALYEITKTMGGGTPGRRAMFLEGVEVKDRFEALARLFNQGELRIQHRDTVAWALVDQYLDIIESCLESPRIPREFHLWMQWREKGKAIYNMHDPNPEPEVECPKRKPK
jgi:hypothetical protein